MLLFIKNEQFTLLNIVCFWGTLSPRPPAQGLCPWTPLGATPQGLAQEFFPGGCNYELGGCKIRAKRGKIFWDPPGGV